MSTSDPKTPAQLRALADREADPNGRTLNSNERWELDEARRVGAKDQHGQKI